MKTNKKDVLFWVIPVFAVVIIFQAVVLVNNAIGKPTTILTTKEATKAAVVDNVIKDDLVLKLVTPDKAWIVGKTYKVTLNVSAVDKKLIDAMDLYVKYDQTAMTVSGLMQGAGLPKPASSKVSTKTGLVVANLYIPGTSSYELDKGIVKDLITFNVVPKKIGDFSFQIDTGKVSPDSVTMLVEAKTAKVIPFAAEALIVKVSK